MRSSVTHPYLAYAAALLLAVCRTPTGVDIANHRARWAARGITSYHYEYRVTGFFINYAGHRIRIDVRNGVVQSATDLDGTQPLGGSLTRWPTIERLFDQVAAADSGRTLLGVRYDPTYDYPTEIDLAGPPDASGSVFASNLVPQP